MFPLCDVPLGLRYVLVLLSPVVVLLPAAVLLRRPEAGLNEELSDLETLVLVRLIVSLEVEPELPDEATPVPLDTPCVVWNLSDPLLCLGPYHVSFLPAPGPGFSPGPGWWSQ